MSAATMIGFAEPAKSKFVPTANINKAASMAESVLRARGDARIGQIIGKPGTGKSEAGRHIVDAHGGVRVCAWANMGRRALLVQIAKKFGIVGSYAADDLTVRILERCPGQLIIIDEANHLRWNVIEALRIFVDEGLAGLILIGTDLLERTFRSAKTEIYLAQMAQRIGAKRVTFEPMKSAEEIAGYVITPRFGQVCARTAAAFLKISQGNWRTALELADACDRAMRTEEISKIDEKLVNTAGAWLARNN